MTSSDQQEEPEASMDLNSGTVRRWPTSPRNALPAGTGSAHDAAHPGAVLEAVPVPVAQFAAIRAEDDDGVRDFECRYANPAARRPDGLVGDLAVGHRMIHRPDGEPLERVFEACREVVESGGDATVRERRLRWAEPGGQSGSPVPPAVDLSVARLGDGVVLSWRRAAGAAEPAAAGRAQSMELLTTLGHELRTPLNAMLGFCSLLQSEITGALNEEQRQHLSRIERSCRHLESLVHDSLDLARGLESGDAEDLEEVDVAAVVEDVVELMEPEARSRALRLRVDCPRGSAPLRTDGGKVRQIVTNLVGNAVKYTEEGEVRVEIEIEEDGDRVCVRVRDTGPGIPPERSEEIFEPYVRLQDDAGEGEGLGLAVCRRLARLLGGEVGVEETAPGEGSTFALRLPRRLG